MFLKTLTLKGFKSFAEPTTLTMEPGVTVVVGPNGSGKSNVVDAISWVLGAQAPSSVRSQKMDDVIFAGTSSKPALGRAEVTLTIDNSGRLLPIEFEEVTISRTLFRSGDSEYAINGVGCRLLDIQDLLSDSGVGRQQHTIISQGQIDAVLNARPEERRLMIEEAAGVLKHRRRREKATRRLDATAANLTRLQDLQREVRRQLRPLERQADAARRHGDVEAELQALRIHIAGREISALRHRLDGAVAAAHELAQRDGELKQLLAGLDTSVIKAEGALGTTGAIDSGEALARYEALRERARGLIAVLAERSRGLERDRRATVDQAVVASLEAEAASVRDQLARVDAEAAALRPDADRLADAEADLEAQRQSFSEEWGDGLPSPPSHAAELRGELAALRQAVETGQTERGRVVTRLSELSGRRERALVDVASLRAEVERADGQGLPLADEAASIAVRRAESSVALEETEAALARAQAEQGAWTARADALALALDEARSRSGAEQLGEIDGMIGTLLELVEVDPGWEAAFEAALGEAVAAVVTADAGSARVALGALTQADAAGAVLALGVGAPDGRGPRVGQALRPHVRPARSVVGLDALLDALVGSIGVVDDWPAAADAALAFADAVVVTRAGDRFGPTGWRIGTPRAGATGAALEEALGHAERAIARCDDARRTVVDQRAELDDIEQRHATLAAEIETNDAGVLRATERLAAVERELRDLDVEIEAHGGQLEVLTGRLARDDGRVAAVTAALPDLEADEAALVERGRQMSLFRSRLDERTNAVATLRSDLEVRAAGVEERRAFLGERLVEIDSRLAANAEEVASAGERRRALEKKLAITEGLQQVVETRLESIESQLTELRAERTRQTDEARAAAARLDELRRERLERERALAENRELQQRSEIEQAEIRLRLEAAVEVCRTELDVEPETAQEAPCPPLADGTTPAARRRELERELKLMGPINPLALQEFEALQERYTFLEGQLDDVKASRRELSKVIRSIDEEIVNVFSSAYADVRTNFEELFSALFPGGKGDLRLTDPTDLLDTGIEVNARPSGKNVRKLSLLSGGERSLTALAFLFAIFRSRPSPFYVMDEVEAALDDVNLHRFLGLVDEFRAEAQLLIVSHQKRTMDAADCLYGVSMRTAGSSTVVSERIGADVT